MSDSRHPSEQPDEATREYGSLYDELEQSVEPRQDTPEEPIWEPVDTRDPRLADYPRWKPLHLILFLLTCGTTFYVGQDANDLSATIRLLREGKIDQADLDKLASAQSSFQIEKQANDREGMAKAGWYIGTIIKSIQKKHLTDEDRYWSGFVYSACVMLTLLFHEMGHYLQARRYRVAASPPYFIPIPNLFGTMGAVIVQRSGFADRKILYDIAISGPLAGLVLALPIVWFGAQNCVIATEAEVAQLFPKEMISEYGDPLLIQWMYEAAHGPLAPNDSVISNALLFAGWVGIFITALNLIPIGQLDGGHILYSLLGRKAHAVAVLLTGGAMAYMALTGNFTYALMLLLIGMMGIRHPPTSNDRVALDPFRVGLGWLTLAFIVIGFTPTPIVM